jgi:RecB family exonuclease
LLDTVRRALSGDLPVRSRRATAERLQLQLAIGAATDRLYLSYPRLDVNESRPRVPSFYALDVTRALTGRIPSHDELQAEAHDPGAATLAWPAPSDPMRAVDAFEHDLAILRPLFDERDAAKVAGRARYLLELNACLGRSVRERWQRYHRQWSDADGLARVTEPVREALAAQRLGARPYSLSALQHYASCPYRFLLSAVYRLAPREEAIALQRLDPLTKGSLFHRVQAEFLRTLRDQGRLPVRPDTLEAALDTLRATLTRVAENERARLAPAIQRVWDDEIGAMRRDLVRWVQMTADAREGWVPQWFEFAFGLPGDEGRDEASIAEPVSVAGRYVLRGSMDLVERHPTGALRVTDHKTGRARWPERMVVAGGEALQPVLYSLVLEAATGVHVHGGRLWFCTAAGEFKEVEVPLTETTRRMGLEVLEIIDRGIEHGLLAPYPRERACQLCDFAAVCGPNEQWRTRAKPAGRFPDLDALRSSS